MAHNTQTYTLHTQTNKQTRIYTYKYTFTQNDYGRVYEIISSLLNLLLKYNMQLSVKHNRMHAIVSQSSTHPWSL